MSDLTEILEFEKPIKALEDKIQALQKVNQSDDDIHAAIQKLQTSLDKLKEKTFSHLTSNQIVALARHPQRPHTSDYIKALFTDVQILHGDRHDSDDAAMITGLAKFQGQSCVVIGQEKGRDTHSRLQCNFGMPTPAGYRKALRVMQLAERFKLPIFTFIDTPGAYPGVRAEEQNQSEAIAKNLFEFSKCTSPIICTVIGEGGSGGALAIGVGDAILMCQYSIYSVISPEGCASILWKSAQKAPDASEALQLTAPQLLKHQLIDAIVPEPQCGAHSNMAQMADHLRTALDQELKTLQALSTEALLERRYERLMLNHLYTEQ
tara:strand:- start:1030 stop:1992 length:963 start_codon:yes stop_codon:yes gene_type:complete